MGRGEIACHKQFLHFSQCFPQLYILSVSKFGIVWEKLLMESVDQDQAVQNVYSNIRSYLSIFC